MASSKQVQVVLAGSDVAMGSLRDRVSEEGIGLVSLGLRITIGPKVVPSWGSYLKFW